MNARGPIEAVLPVNQDGWFSHLSLDYHDGAKIPHLERIPRTPDTLEEIMKPRATPSKVSPSR